MTTTHVNLFSHCPCDCPPVNRSNSTDTQYRWGCSQLDRYSELIRLLEATRDFKVDGVQFRLAIEPLPPKESVNTRCTVPADLPSTPFNETALFDPTLGYQVTGDQKFVLSHHHSASASR